MGNMNKIIQALNLAYATASVNKMKELCHIGGIEYKDPALASTLMKDLYANGYTLRITKISVADVAVGQTIMLMDLDNTFIKGYQIWIDFQDDYRVKEHELFSTKDIIEFGGGVVH